MYVWAEYIVRRLPQIHFAPERGGRPAFGRNQILPSGLPLYQRVT